MTSVTHINRRALLRALSMSSYVLTGVGVFSSAERAEATAAGFISAHVSLLQPRTTAGQEYFDERLLRQDITEGRPGMPMELRLQIVTGDGLPMPGARVDVWHCDALGRYAGAARPGDEGGPAGETFLRGTQMSGADGVVRFHSIYPGRNAMRGVQLHYRVFPDRRNVAAGQVDFPEALSEYLFRNVSPYLRRDGGQHRADRIAGTDRAAGLAEKRTYAAVYEQPDAYEVRLVIGMDAGATAIQAATAGNPGIGLAPGGAIQAGRLTP